MNHPTQTFRDIPFTPERARHSRSRLISQAGLMAGLVLSALTPQAGVAQNTWNGQGGTTNWSTPGNWSYGAAPASYDPVLFDNLVPGAASGVIDNTVDSPFTIYSLQYSTVSTNGYHTTLIPAGRSLNINGSGGNALYVGTMVPQNTESVYSRFVGPGALTITNTAGAINVVQGGQANDHYATLDLSGLTNFAASVSQVLVGCQDNTALGLRPMGVFRLADTNFIQTAAGSTQPGIMVAAYPTSDTNLRGTQQLFLGRYNIFNCDAISVAGHKSTGQILFRSGLTGGYARLRGSGGGSDAVKLLTIGDQTAGIVAYDRGGTSVGNSGTFDTSGNFLDALVTDLYVARGQGSSSGVTTGVFTYDQGTVVADNLYIGYQSPATATAAFNAVGTVNVNGNATLTVNNDLVLALKTGTNIPTGTLNVAPNATVNVKGNVVTSGGTSTLALNGTLNLQPAGDPTRGSLSVGTLSGSGVVTNAAGITSTIALTPGTAALPGTLSLGADLTLAANAVFNVNLGSSLAPGQSDLVSVAGNLNLNNNTVNLVPSGGVLASGTYGLITFSGVRNGSLSFTNPTRYTAALDYGANQVSLAVSGVAGNLKWNSTASSAWDLSSLNWLNTVTAALDRFLQLDNVLIDDSVAATNLLVLTTTLYPGTVTVSSSGRNYALGGSGKLSGGASLVKNGTSTLTLSNANDFIGSVQVNGGILKLANNSALGATNGSTTIASGATLDLNGAALYSPGELITIAGTGLNNTGAVINTGAAQNNAIRFLTLSGDASVQNVNRFDVRGPAGSGTFSGALNLNGFTLTKLGAAQMSLADAVVTNAGTIVIAGGTLGLTRSQVDGPGYINVLTNVLLFENSSVGYVAKPISVSGGTLSVTGNALALDAPVTNVSGLTINAAVNVTLNSGISGSGALTKLGSATLVLNAANPYTGATAISAGRLTVSTNGSVALTPSISVAAGASLDVSAVNGGFVVANGQTLSGSGSVIGDVNVSAGATLVPGSSPGTLTFSNSLSLNGATAIVELGGDPTQLGGTVNDLIAVNGNLTLNGQTTIKVVPTAPLSSGTPYTILTYAGSLSGTLANLRIISDNPRYTFTILDPATTPNALKISVSGVPTTLTWKGGASGNANAWDTATANWLNGGVADTFFSGDSVLFNDTATTGLITLPGAIQAGTVTLNNNAQSYAFTGAGGLTAGALVKQGSGTLTVGNNAGNTFGGGFAVSGGSVSLTNNGVNDFGSGMTIDSATVTIANAAANSFGPSLAFNSGLLQLRQGVDATIGAAISDNGVGGTLVKQGPNTLTLSGNNTNFDGPILVSSGILRAANIYALGNPNGSTTVAEGATLDINGSSLYNPGETVIIYGAGLNSTGAVINTGGAQQNALRSLVLSNSASIAAWNNRWDVRGPGGSGSFSGLLNLGGFTLTKLGPGTNAIVDADVTSAGSIRIAGGVLSFTRCNVDGEGSINLLTNTLFLENYSAGYFSKPLISSGGILRLAGNSFALGSTITNLAGLMVDVASGQTLTSQGPILGAGTYTKANSGTHLLTSTENAWGGSTTISAGTLQIGNGGAEGNLPDLPVLNNGTLNFNSLNDITSSHEISGSGTVQLLAGGTVTLTASNSYTGPTVISSTTANSLSGGALRIANNYALGTGAGNTRIVGNNNGNGRLELVGNITVAEPLQVDCRQAATIDMPAVLNVSGTNTLTGPVAGNTGGSDINFQSDSGKLILTGSFNAPGTAGTRRLKLMGASLGEWSGIISNSPDGITALTHVVKTGSGTWTLSGANVYGGTTTVNEGTLALAGSGSINNSASIDVLAGAKFDVTATSFTVAPGQTVKGEGSVIGTVRVGAGGTVAAGETIGALTISQALTFGPGSTNLMELDKASVLNDVVNAASITYGGTLVVTELSGLPLVMGDTFKLFNASSYNGTFAAVSLPPLETGLGWDLSGLTVNGTIKVGPAVSPNPTKLSFTLSNKTVDISWPADHTGWRLEAQTNSAWVGLSGNWQTVPNSTSTNRLVLPIDPANGAVFYRLVYP